MNVKIWAVEKLMEIRYKSKWKKCFEKKKKDIYYALVKVLEEELQWDHSN